MNVINKMKKAGTKHLWRIKQASTLISVFLWSISLTGIFYNFIQWRLVIFGVENFYAKFALIFAAIFTTIFIVGYLYDQTFKLWRPYLAVATEKNPFHAGTMSPFEILTWPRAQASILSSYADRIEKRSDESDDKKLAARLRGNADALIALARASVDDPGMREFVEDVNNEVNNNIKSVEGELDLADL